MDEDTGLEENPITTNRFHEISEQGLSLYGGLRFRATSICFSYLLSVAAYVRRADRVSRWKFSNNSTRGFFFPFPLDSFLSLFVFIRALQLLFIFRNVIKKFFPESIFSSFIGSFSIFQYVSLYLSFLYFLSLYFSKCDWKRKNFSPNQALIFYQLLFDFWIRIFASFVVLILFLNLAFIVIFFFFWVLFYAIE